MTTVTSNQSSSYLQCDFKYSAIHTTLFAIEGLVMVYGIKLCYAVKDLPDAVNESKFIAMGNVKIILLVCVIMIYNPCFHSDHCNRDDLRVSISYCVFDKFVPTISSTRCKCSIRIGFVNNYGCNIFA